jgi:nucleoside-diphosphate-sugar epimerase
MSHTPRSKILVTGGTGLIGRYAVADLVARGHDVHVITRKRQPCGLTRGATFQQVDLADEHSIREVFERLRPTHLLHLAWETRHGVFWSAEENLNWIAITMHLARAFHAAGGRRLVGAGTCAEYDWNDQGLMSSNCNEADTPIAPGHLYGVAKDATRKTLEAYAKTTGLEFAWARVFFLFDHDENERRFVRSIISNLRARKRASCSPGTQIRDFMHAADVGAAFAALLLSETKGAVNIGSGVARTLAEVAITIGELMGRSELIGLGDIPARSGEPHRLVADTRRLTVEVGYNPDMSFRERLNGCISLLMERNTDLSLS